jgi:DNA-binding response OmpR family regulator
VNRIKGANILLITDHSIVGRLLFELFQDKGGRLHHAPAGTEALKLFKRREFNLVILDDMLPFDSSKMISRIKQLKPGVPVLLINAEHEKKEPGNLQGPRADVVVPRPVKMDTILPLASQALSVRYKS